MRIKFKKGVEIRELTSEMLNVIDKVITVWKVEGHGVTPVITSAFDIAPGRAENTKHYTHQALDFRTRNLRHPMGAKHLAEGLSRVLGKDYDVVLEEDHIHVEYDPKKGG